MNSPNCNHDPETTVLCHSNDKRHGKGWGIKASDEFTFYGCSDCNYFFDEIPADKELKRRLFWAAWARTQILFKEKGLTEVII